MRPVERGAGVRRGPHGAFTGWGSGRGSAVEGCAEGGRAPRRVAMDVAAARDVRGRCRGSGGVGGAGV